MPSLASLAAATLFAAAANAHFTLNVPPTIGFDDDKEPTGPCGSFTPDFSKDTVSDFHVGGDSIATTLLHPQGTWLFRAVAGTDLPADDSSEWTQLFPQVLQTGLGKFCEPAVAAPAAWAGQQGILSVVVDAPDGLLYQCAAVRFVAGAAPSVNSACTNASGVAASFATDGKLTPLAGAGTAGAGTTGTGSSTAASSTSTTSTSTTSTSASSTSATAATTSTAATTTAAPASTSTKTSAASLRSASLLSVGGLAVLAAALHQLL